MWNEKNYPPNDKTYMSLRSGIQQFYQNAKQWGLRSGTQVRDFFNKGREVARRIQPHLEKGTKFAETVNRHAQQALTDPEQRRQVASWTTRLRKFTDDYNVALNKIDLAHDVITAPG